MAVPKFYEFFRSFLTVLMRLIFVGAFLVMACIGGILQSKSGDKDEQIVTSQSLHEELNEERKQQGRGSLPAINSGQTSTNTYARMDKSWRSVPDFFLQLIRGRRK